MRRSGEHPKQVLLSVKCFFFYTSTRFYTFSRDLLYINMKNRPIFYTISTRFGVFLHVFYTFFGKKQKKSPKSLDYLQDFATFDA